jgi:hypothetical protein
MAGNTPLPILADEERRVGSEWAKVGSRSTRVTPIAIEMLDAPSDLSVVHECSR